MFASLYPDLLSLPVSLPDSIRLAHAHGFGGVDVSGGHLISSELDLVEVKELFDSSGVKPGYIALPPGRMPCDEGTWSQSLEQLPAICNVAQGLGYRRAALVVLPFHASKPFEAAFNEYVERLSQAVSVLTDFGIALGLEYVSPITRRAGQPNPFIYTMNGMLELCAAVAGPERVGLMLDSFHWHCAEESLESIAALPKEQIVVVHLNDAPDVPQEEQTVFNRAFPGETGVIDLGGFLSAIRSTGYDGPITCEPMPGAIQSLPDSSTDAVIAHTAKTMLATLGQI